ncbi:hypothetical protein FQN49_003752 [Arthroderma sp. PD_2]|nr:hypothetical protein FQN49_003752 [Arthroderma sp. PD_2]
MPSLNMLLAAAAALFVISCNGLPIFASRGVGHRSDLQTGYSMAENEAALAWRKVLCQAMRPGQRTRRRMDFSREELEAHSIQNGGQVIMKTDHEAQYTDTESQLRDAEAGSSISLSPSETSGYLPDAAGVIASFLDDNNLPDYLKGYTVNSPKCLLLVHESSNMTLGSSRGIGRIEFLTPGVVITAVVIFLLATIAFFDFMQWIQLYRRKSEPQPGLSKPSFMIDDKTRVIVRYSDNDDEDDSQKEMIAP